MPNLCEIQLDKVTSRFWHYVHRRQDHQCWPWIGSLTLRRGGYGQLNLGRRAGVIKAHRLSWLVHFGALPDGQLLRHLCNNPLCCNPSHLLPGTPLDNHLDMQLAGRMKVPEPPRGVTHKNSVLSESDVTKIRESVLPGPVLARQFGVSRSTISHIRRRITWKHLP